MHQMSREGGFHKLHDSLTWCHHTWLTTLYSIYQDKHKESVTFTLTKRNSCVLILVVISAFIWEVTVNQDHDRRAHSDCCINKLPLSITWQIYRYTGALTVRWKIKTHFFFSYDIYQRYLRCISCYEDEHQLNKGGKSPRLILLLQVIFLVLCLSIKTS